MIEDVLSTVVSRHSDAHRYRCDVRGHHLNAWCRLAGTPFADGLSLLPNHPRADPVAVAFGPLRLPSGVDTLTCLFSSPSTPRHLNELRVHARILDDQRAVVTGARASLRAGDEAALTLRFEDQDGAPIILIISVSFEHFDGGTDFGSVRMGYALAYRGNELIELFNDAGSDKGTEKFWGGGVPHCYAVTYQALLSGFREEAFNLLEIGLDTSSQHDGRPSDAPSLRVWRRFLPQASLYGLDRNDFSFFDQPGTVTFRADQGSREDLGRFVEAHPVSFRVIIDDGSHASSHQQVSLAKLFNRLEPGGMYIIEDLHWQPRPEHPTTLELLRTFERTGAINTPFMTDEEARMLESQIESVSIHKPNDSEIAVIARGSE